MEEISETGSNTGCGSFFHRTDNQDNHNVFPDVVHIKRGSSFLTINPENPRALQKLTTDDVLNSQFHSCEDAKSFYQLYASVVGFVVQEDEIGRKKQNEGQVVMRRWVCNKQGFQRNNYHPSSSTEVNCPAAFCITLGHFSHKWSVTEFVVEHTHDLAPTCQSQLQMDPSLMTSENEITPSDVESALDYLSAKKDNDDGLFYEAKFVEGHLTSLFWADSIAQLDNACFGEVMAVYRTNSSLMHFVILAGLNHHHQACVFGCALLQDETTESYTWLFQTFLRVTQGCMPVSVLTDGHKALHKAIKHVLPRSRHQLCTWHLEKNARSFVNKPSFISDFKVCMEKVLSPDDFELKWKGMVGKYKLSENPWIHRMHKKRHMWAETYLRGHFSGGLKNTQVCESIDKLLSRFSQNQLKLHQFISIYDRTIDMIRWDEGKAQYESKGEMFALSTSLVKIEKHAADVFTRESYKRFLSEMKSENLLFVLNKHDGSNHRTYRLSNSKHQNSACEVVMFKPSGPNIKCSCLKFETLGFPCSHAIHVIKSEGLVKIPQHLIHPRWTKSAKSTAQFWKRCLPPVSSDVVIKMVQYGTLMSKCSVLCYLASKTTDWAYRSVHDAICKHTHELMEHSCACQASNKGTISEDGILVSRIASSEGSQTGGYGYKRRKTNTDDGHARNVQEDI